MSPFLWDTLDSLNAHGLLTTVANFAEQVQIRADRLLSEVALRASLAANGESLADYRVVSNDPWDVA